MPEDKLPADDDNKKEDPFEEFINRDLGMDSVMRENEFGLPDGEDDFPAGSYLPHEADDDDDSSPFTPRFGGFASRLPSTGGSIGDSSFRSFGGRSPFGSSPSSSSSGSFGRPPSRPFGTSGSLKFTRSEPEPPRTPAQRFLNTMHKLIGEEMIFFVLAFAMLLVIASTLLYIDNLRLSIAVRDGQIQELRTQLIDLQRQITPTAELPIEPATDTAR
ncbi:hypothetical protein VZO05_10395 [Aggregatilineales bacterium SYSU G02658]